MGAVPGSKQKALMASTPQEALVLDFVLCSPLQILFTQHPLPLEGKGQLSFSLAVPGSSPEAAVRLGMHCVAEEDFQVEIRYPTRQGKEAAYKAKINCRC